MARNFRTGTLGELDNSLLPPGSRGRFGAYPLGVRGRGRGGVIPCLGLGGHRRRGQMPLCGSGRGASGGGGVYVFVARGLQLCFCSTLPPIDMEPENGVPLKGELSSRNSRTSGSMLIGGRVLRVDFLFCGWPCPELAQVSHDLLGTKEWQADGSGSFRFNL